MATLRSIADQCPDDGGFAVFKARVLCQRFDPTASWEINTGCGEERQHQEVKPYRNDHVAVVQPNPANQQVRVIALPGSRIEFFNMYGVSANITLLDGDTEIPVGNWSAGVYYYRVSDPTGLIYTGKLIISH